MDLFGNSKLVVPFSEKDLRCKNECGFYGNPQWQGFCSKCWRDYLKQINNNSSGGVVSPTLVDARSPSPTAGNSKSWHTSLGFDKFLEKKNQHTNRRSSTLRNILKKSPSSDNTRSLSPTHSKSKKQPLQRQLSIESLNAKENFFTFLRQLPGAMAQDVSKQVKNVVDRIFQHTEVIPIEDLSGLVHEMYDAIELRLRTTNVKESTHSTEQIMNEVEQYICSRCYSILFCPSTDEEVGDLSLQDRIRSLNWVTYGFLDPGFALENPVVRDKVDGAVTEIIDMNSRRGPQQKLNSVLQCSKLLFEALKESRNGQPASADEFLPAFIYVILKSNPPLLQSNVQFVSRFAIQSKLMSGEAGYYFTNLCCAMNFVQNLNADSLKMPKEEFEAYTSGQLIPPLNESTSRCQQAIKSLEHSWEELTNMQDRSKQLSNDVLESMNERHSREWGKLIDDVIRFNEAYPPPKSLDDWLESSPEKERMLPLPLVPTALEPSAVDANLLKDQ